MSKDKARRESFLKIIQEWKWYWMNQTQNSEEDYLNYQRRAHGIDANMKYDLADRLADREDALEAKLAVAQEAIQYALANNDKIKGWDKLHDAFYSIAKLKGGTDET